MREGASLATPVHVDAEGKVENGTYTEWAVTCKTSLYGCNTRQIGLEKEPWTGQDPLGAAQPFTTYLIIINDYYMIVRC